jgi:cytochrome c biogenesis protein CcmG/thiol:disulfide interchange protein DsbE
VRGWQPLVGMILVLATALAACTGPGQAVPRGITEGSRARDFTLESLHGGRVSLSDHEGSVVLINLWATWCPPCRAEIPAFEAAYRAYKDEGFVVLGINVQESADTVAAFVAEMDVTYPVLLDEGGKLMNDYRGLGLPMSLLVDREGVLALRHMGFLSDDILEENLARLLSNP